MNLDEYHSNNGTHGCPAWLASYVSDPDAYRKCLLGANIHPIDGCLVVFALAASPEFWRKINHVDRVKFVDRVVYWFGQDPDFRRQVDYYQRAFLLARGGEASTAADRLFQFCNWCELLETPSQRIEAKLKKRPRNRIQEAVQRLGGAKQAAKMMGISPGVLYGCIARNRISSGAKGDLLFKLAGFPSDGSWK